MMYSTIILVIISTLLAAALIYIYILRSKVRGSTAIVLENSKQSASTNGLNNSNVGPLEKYEFVCDKSLESILLIDSEGIVLECNRVLEELSGLPKEQIVGHPYREVAHTKWKSQEERQKLFSELVNGKTDELHNLEIVFRNGIERYINLFSKPVKLDNGSGGVYIVIRDITEHRRLQMERSKLLDNIQKLHKQDSLGTMTANIAHQINDPVNSIMNYGQLIYKRMQDQDNQLKEYAFEIVSECERIAEIVRNLLKFSGTKQEEYSSVHIHSLIERSVSLLRSSMIKSGVNLDVNIEENIPMLSCHGQQMQQVLLCLIQNALYALNMRYDGKNENKILKIEAKCEQEEGDDRRTICIVVEDHGLGIPKDLMNKIFEPFFTTKPSDIATGLGLPVSNRIVRDHGGRMWVESVLGKFARFHVDLPAADFQS